MELRKKVDRFFAALVMVTSFVSVLALGAILLFVFVEGAEPFLFSTAQGVSIVCERIVGLRVNGVFYSGAGTIGLPKGTRNIAISFGEGAGERSLDLTVNGSELTLNRTPDGADELSNPEAFVYTADFPGAMPGLSQKVHIILPEPPYSFLRFLTGLEWRPTYQKLYGILPMIVGSILAGFGAILLGVPIGLLCAVFLAEFIPEKAAAPLRACIELLAGIPSVVYGFFGLMMLSPLVKNIFHTASGNCLLTAVIMLAVMILPTVITITETSLRAVPQSQREASMALGASKMQTAWRVVLVHARSGVIAGIILGISRAVGETMAVILVAGNSVQLVHSPLDSVRTLTATIALEMGYAQGRHSSILFSIGIVLFALILLLNASLLAARPPAGSRIAPARKGR
ncbi:MAG: phosphate ABC transporter permease subunit PstC [Spirochaetaceae bacterium]|nr:phosphate ABC transporter permease subunit PstC [Spirochaetaceae bacterium]